MDSLWRHLIVGVAHTPGILAFRLLPFVGFATITRSYSWLTRLFVLALYVPLLIFAARMGATPFYWLLLAYLYFAGAVWVSHELLPYTRSKGAWFTTVALLFWVLPSLLVHPAPQTFLVLGWDFTLAAYSYGVDTRRTAAPALNDFLFFVLVNPTLVYHKRGERVGAPSLDPRGLARAGLGVLAVLVSVGPMQAAQGYGVARLHVGPLGGAAAALGWLAVGVVGFCREYAVQSGVASVQIGCMKQLGYRLPERYRYPWLAQSPGDFWHRWNTYVGGWAQAYVFLPLMLALPPQWRRGRDRTRAAYAAAVVLTFAVIGVFHDAYVMAAEWRWTASRTGWFLAMGFLVVVWEALAWRRSRSAAEEGGRRLAARAMFLLAASCSAASFH